MRSTAARRTASALAALCVAFGGASTALADEYSDLVATAVRLTPLGGDIYDVEVDVAVVFGTYVPSQPVLVRLYYGGNPIDEVVFGPAQPPVAPPATPVCCFSDAGCPDATGYTKSCEGECPTPNLGAPRVCRYKKPVLFPQKFLPRCAPQPPPVPGSVPNRLAAVIDPDGWHYEVDDPNRTNNTASAEVPWDEACDLSVDTVTLSATPTAGQYDVDVAVSIAPGSRPPSMPLHVSLRVDDVLFGYVVFDTISMPPAECCYGVIECTPVSGYTASCGGSCANGFPGQGVCAYSRIGTFPITSLQPGDVVTAESDPDGLFAESCAPGTANNVISIVVPPVASSYCTGQVNSAGCVATVTFSGSPSATSPDPFVIGAQSVLRTKPGILFYGFAKNTTSPFMCVQSPVRRTPIQIASGLPGDPDCSGTFAFDFNERIRSGVDPALAPGAFVAAQHWYRDPASPAFGGTSFSNALWFQIGD
jgi:hypothetical protein